jgi:DNA damage-responsive transcriptional repressor / [histone H3]-trimethyl-L-lysine36 demethylase
VISRAAGYHSGFNAGYNIAEAVNFALPAWIEVGSKASACLCARDSVKINMDQFLDTLKLAPSNIQENHSQEETKTNKTIQTLQTPDTKAVDDQLLPVARIFSVKKDSER